MASSTVDDVRAAKSRAMAIFAPLADVVGVGITRVGEGYGLKINLRAAPATKLPEEVDGVPVKVEIVGSPKKR